MAMLYVGGAADSCTTALPTPSSYEYLKMDVDSESTGRAANGDMIRDRVAVKRKVSCVWNGLSQKQISAILGNSYVKQVSFYLKFPDAETGELATMHCYVGDRTAPMWNYNHGEPVWDNLSMNFVEM